MASIMYCLVSVLLLTSQLCGMEAKLTEFPKEESALGRSLLTTEDKPEVHIVYLGGVSELTTTNDENVHLSMLSEALGSLQGAHDSILYSYTKSFNGFAASFSEYHAETIRGMEGVVSVFKQQILEHYTTASWRPYLGLDPTQGIWAQTDFGNNTIIGLVDTGIWPEHVSFTDDGFGPIPSKWKGSCEKGQQFTKANCNKKLIGAKYFSKGIGPPEPGTDYNSARDADGHGTHTSSTAGGNQVVNASVNGVANGTASGGAPSARIAMYKACWTLGCAGSDILAAMEAAISDGVDILSLSLGGPAVDYASDVIAIGAFHAVEKGIVVSCAAGNSGNATGTATNIAPWIFTVAASTINRVYQSDVQLIGTGGNTVVQGIAINSNDMNSAYPIVSGADIGDPTCFSPSDPKKAHGKIIVCEGGGSPDLVFQLGAVGWIDITDQDEQVQFYSNNCSNTNVDSTAGDEILKFINSTKKPTAIIDKSVATFNTTPAPVIGYFSSVGPNIITPDVPKPDISAPGVDIIAAWAPNAYADYPGDYPFPDWNIISGTSMATPHVAGTTALVKSAHPDWSPGAIKSAIMTTATPFNTSIAGNFELASGSGQINPAKAADPGLVFNLTTTDYVNFLCAIGYNTSSVDLITGGKDTCPPNPTTVLNMNYPSIYLSTNVTAGVVHNITRTVTNVGPNSGTAKYSVTVNAPQDVDVVVTPSTLEFEDINTEQSFTVSVTITSSISAYNYGSIIWNDDSGTHSVRMVIGAGQTV